MTLDDLRRRVDNDPASIAFAQLAEEYRRAGRLQDAVEICRSGLQRDPGYTSARLTLARALLALEKCDEARAEFASVLAESPRSLAALRGLASIHQRSGEVQRALPYYEAALAIAPSDPELQDTVSTLRLHRPAWAETHPAAVTPEDRVDAAGPQDAADTDDFADTDMAAGLAVDELADSGEADIRTARTLAALGHWLTAVHVTRAERRP